MHAHLTGKYMKPWPFAPSPLTSVRTGMLAGAAAAEAVLEGASGGREALPALQLSNVGTTLRNLWLYVGF